MFGSPCSVVTLDSMKEAVALTDAVHVFPLLLKATPKVEDGQRIIYCEPSNEATDLEGERVLRQALMESREYFLEKGNLDLDHKSLLGYQQGLDSPRKYEIGRPLEVRFDEGRTFVKGLIYQGTGPMAEKANEFWSSITEVIPPMPWYPSVGGHVRDAGTILPKGAATPVRAIRKVFWNNIGFAREPVNPTVPGVSMMPLGTFAKAWIGCGSTLEYVEVSKESDLFEKTLTAGYGADKATLTGGAALREESLHGVHKIQGATQLGKDLLRGRVKRRGARMEVEDLVSHLISAGMPRAHALEAVEHFLADLSKKGVRQ